MEDESLYQGGPKGGNNLFTFHFGSREDRQKVYSGGPWLIKKQLLSLVKPRRVSDITSMEFSRVSFWVQIFNVPMACDDEERALFFGKLIGYVEDVNLSRPIMSVRVRIDVSKPLK